MSRQQHNNDVYWGWVCCCRWLARVPLRIYYVLLMLTYVLEKKERWWWDNKSHDSKLNWTTRRHSSTSFHSSSSSSRFPFLMEGSKRNFFLRCYVMYYVVSTYPVNCDVNEIEYLCRATEGTITSLSLFFSILVDSFWGKRRRFFPLLYISHCTFHLSFSMRERERFVKAKGFPWQAKGRRRIWGIFSLWLYIMNEGSSSQSKQMMRWGGDMRKLFNDLNDTEMKAPDTTTTTSEKGEMSHLRGNFNDTSFGELLYSGLSIIVVVSSSLSRKF